MRNNFIGTALMFLVCWSLAVFALEEDPLSGNPFHCTVSAKSKDSCVSLNHCVWCQGDSLPGICVSDKQERALIKKIPHVKCFENTAATPTTPPRLRVGESIAAGAPYDPKCLQAPSFAAPGQSPEEACNAARDSKGDMCAWCDAAGVFSLCLSHQQATDASPYLQCDIGDVLTTV
jgi:hypothetical protein